jgi:ribonuclease HII
MILAGIDEAGYGPLLGPLVVGCCAFVVDGADPAADLPCLWKRLKKITSKNRSKTGRKLHINDSKLVYSPATGLKELERSVLAVAGTLGPTFVERLEDFIQLTAAHAVTDLAEHRWYVPFDGETFPLEQQAASIRVMCNGLKAEMEQSGTRCAYLAARLVPERQFNRMVEATRNKSSALFSIAAIHLDYLLKTYGHDGLVIFCDRQGGRGHYGHLLRLMFEDWAMEIVCETISDKGGRSEYRLTRGDDVVRIIFCEKAEAQCMPVALASMLSKYLRETTMRRFNAFWRQHLPDIAPTAGYYGDGERFLNDIDVKRRELGIADHELIRCR